MARPTSDVDFGAWLRPRMLAAGLTQTDLRRRLEDAGIDVGKQTVSQWYNGSNTPVPDTVVAIAQLLGADPADALRRAGHERVAALIGGTQNEGGTSLTPAPPTDPIVEEILNDPAIPADLKDRVITFYRRQAQMARENTREFSDGLKPQQ